MSKIRVLSEHTINKIAAGEVIENPASVVKELVENALDAGATEITVEIRGGGRQLIRITDNGSGMDSDDALLCLERHATSKLKEVEDLQTIETMGFRGEAVPSVAAISKMAIRTCLQGKSVGTLLQVEGGQVRNVSSAPCQEGTTFEVKDLFFNVPVRKNFQRSPAYDAQEIQKMLTQLALAHPQIRFALISNQETVFAAKSPSLQGRIDEVLGKEFAQGLKPVKQVGDLTIEGFLGEPAFARSNRSGQYLFINKRCVFSPLVAYALREGYGPSLPAQRHPTYVLHLTLPGTLVDVNVHPQKKEVRLRQEQELKELLIKSVESILYTAPKVDFTPKMELPSSCSYETFTPSRFPMQFKEAPEIPSPLALQPTLFAPIKPLKATLKVVATLPGYILIEKEEGIALVDQRRAHMRIIFDQLRQSSQITEQPLLIPFTIELALEEAEALKSYIPLFNAMGIALREFGPRTFSVDALPTTFGNVDVEALILTLLKKIHEFRDQEVFQRHQESIIAEGAAKAAIGREKKLSIEEAQSLINRWNNCEEGELCPQGKKVSAYLRKEEFSKWF